MSSNDKTKLSAPEMILEKNPVIEWLGKIILIIKTTIKNIKICSTYITSFYKYAYDKPRMAACFGY